MRVFGRVFGLVWFGLVCLAVLGGPSPTTATALFQAASRHGPARMHEGARRSIDYRSAGVYMYKSGAVSQGGDVCVCGTWLFGESTRRNPSSVCIAVETER